MKIKRNISFQLDRRKNKDGILSDKNIAIRIRITYGGTRSDLFTGYRIDLSKWDPEKQRVKNGSYNKQGFSASQINADLNRQSTAIEEIFDEYERLGQFPTKSQFAEAFNDKTRVQANEEGIARAAKAKALRAGATPATAEAAAAAAIAPKDAEGNDLPKQPTFWELIDRFVVEQGRENSWTHSTAEKFYSMKTHLLNFRDQKFRKEDLTFDTFGDKTLYDYVDFLMKKEGLRNSSAEKQLKLLKWFFRWALREKYHTNTAYETFQPKLKKVEKAIIFLTREELMKINNYLIPDEKQYLERTRDIFLFCCFTGLRYSDVSNLRWGDIQDDHIVITTIKTHDTIAINLNSQSRAIIEKYRDAGFENGLVLPIISNQKYNDYIKELARLAEITDPVHTTYYKGGVRVDEVHPKWELLGSHSARKTFISNSLIMGIQPEVVMKWTGHSDYSAMKPYIEISNKAKADSMKMLDNFLEPDPEPEQKPAPAKKPAKKKSGK